MEGTLLEATKREQDYDWPASAFLYVPDAEKPSTWKLRIKEVVNGRAEVTKAQLGRAAAALGKGFRGETVAISAEAKAAAKRKLRGLYAKLGVKPEDMPPAIREGDEPDGAEDLLFEDVHAFEGTRVDGEAGTIRDVVLAGPTSKNGRRYRTAGLANAVRLYDGVRVYLNHPTDDELKARHGGRDVRELAGWVTDPHFSEGKVKGTVNLLPNHGWLLEVAARKPDLLGMSHVARGSIAKEGDETIVEEILSVRSVDIVSDPATTRSLFEQHRIVDGDGDEGVSPDGHENGGTAMTTKELRESHPDLVAEIKEEILKEIKAGGELEGLRAKVKTLEESVTTLTKERDDLKAKIAAGETARVLEEKLAGEEIPDKVKARVRQAFEGKTAKAEDIDAAIKELREIATEFVEGEKKGRTPIIASDRKGERKTEDVRESVIYTLMGAARPEKKEA